MGYWEKSSTVVDRIRAELNTTSSRESLPSKKVVHHIGGTTVLTNKYEPKIPSVVGKLRNAGEDFKLLTIQRINFQLHHGKSQIQHLPFVFQLRDRSHHRYRL